MSMRSTINTPRTADTRLVVTFEGRSNHNEDITSLQLETKKTQHKDGE